MACKKKDDQEKKSTSTAQRHVKLLIIIIASKTFPKKEKIELSNLLDIQLIIHVLFINVIICKQCKQSEQ